MQTVEKPYLEDVPQFGQIVLGGRRASFLMACSGEVGIFIVFVLLLI